MKSPGTFRKTLTILMPYFVYNVACVLAQILLFQLLQLVGQYFGESYISAISENPGAAQGIMTGLYTLAGLLAVRRAARTEIGPINTAFRPYPAPETVKKPAPSPSPNLHITPQSKQVMEYMLLIALAFTSALGINLIFSVTGFTEISAAYARTAENQFRVPFALGLIVFGLISPLAEEVLFRGIIFNRMKKYYPILPAFLLSSLLFAIFHQNIVQGTYAMIMGFLMAFVYYRFKAFLAPVLFHSVANISVFTLAYSETPYWTAVRLDISIVLLVVSVVLFLIINKLSSTKTSKTPRKNNY